MSKYFTYFKLRYKSGWNTAYAFCEAIEDWLNRKALGSFGLTLVRCIEPILLAHLVKGWGRTYHILLAIGLG